MRKPGLVTVVGVGAVLVLSGCTPSTVQTKVHSADKSTPKKAPSEAAAPEAIPTAESLKLDPLLINNPEALAKIYTETTITGWINSGYGEANAKLARNSGNSTTFADGIATAYDKVYEDALLPANWHSIQSLVDFASNIHSVHAQTLDYNYNTMPSLKIDSANKEAYAGGYTFVSLDKVVTNADASVTIRDIELPYNNANKNMISQLSSQTVDGKKVYTTMTYKLEEGKLVMIDQAPGQEIK
jgi:hypothetical protein